MAADTVVDGPESTLDTGRNFTPLLLVVAATAAAAVLPLLLLVLLGVVAGLLLLLLLLLGFAGVELGVPPLHRSIVTLHLHTHIQNHLHTIYTQFYFCFFARESETLGYLESDHRERALVGRLSS